MTGDDSDRFSLLARLFEELLPLDLGARQAAIRERCGGDPSLEEELRALFAADYSGDPDPYIDRVVGSEAASLESPDASGKRLGPWRVVRPLGEGGMGTVYLAERADGAYEARAAVKLVRGGLPSAGLDERFRAERQILAGLSHPGIAKLLDGGSTEDGTPYLVMELIEGDPITDWCASRGLGIDERLRIFRDVCEAVGYAHGQLVAHRDIKPSNILVGQDGAPKLLDFGIAKLVDSMEGGSDPTRTASLMTPAYASPEQVSGDRTGVPSDVYALGVLLYELLTGVLPLPTSGLTPIELQRVVLRNVPPLASSAVDDPVLRRRLAGDLDAVLSRALRKEPDERYPTVRALSEDLERHLSGMPVQVRHDDWIYRTGKMVRRNAGIVTGSLASMIALVGFSVSTFVQSQRIAQERDRAEAEAATAERVSGFLEELLSEADPNTASGADVTAREVLDRGATRILSELDSEPEVRSALASVMGRVYRRLGEYDAAGPLLDSALAVRRRIGDGDPVALGEVLLERGALWYDVGAYEEALQLHREAAANFEEAFGGDEPRLASSLDWAALSLIELGRFDEAEELSRRHIAMQRRLFEDEPNVDLATGLISLASILRALGEYEEAEELGREGLAIMRDLHGDVHLDVAWALNQLTSTLRDTGRGEEAVALVQEGLSIRQTVFDGPHVEVAASLGNLANVYGGLGRLEESLDARRRATEMLQAIFPESHPYVAGSLFSLGEALYRVERYDEAILALEESAAQHRVVFSDESPNLAYPLTSLGRTMLALGRPADAESFLREAYEVRSRNLPEGHWHVAATGLELGRALERQGRVDEAERLLREAYDLLDGQFGPDDDRTAEARDALREHYVGRGLPERAAELEGQS